MSLENVLLDVKELNRGMELTRREYSMHGHNTMLKEFVAHSEGKLKKLQEDAKIAQVGTAPPGCGPGESRSGGQTSPNVPLLFPQDAFEEAVKFFGENSKTTPPSVFFPVFVRFVRAYRVSVTSRAMK